MQHSASLIAPRSLQGRAVAVEMSRLRDKRRASPPGTVGKRPRDNLREFSVDQTTEPGDGTAHKKSAAPALAGNRAPVFSASRYAPCEALRVIRDK